MRAFKPTPDMSPARRAVATRDATPLGRTSALPVSRPFSRSPDRNGTAASQARHPLGRATVAGVLSGPSRPLPDPVRAEMEARLGSDFSDVRVHDDAAAHRSARALSADAFTAGSHIVFGRGHYDDATVSGRTLLAHELTHVVQQRRGPVGGSAEDGLAISHPGDPWERAADLAGRRAMARPLPTLPPAPSQGRDATAAD
jgi:uncharacterized protein DUF4157